MAEQDPGSGPSLASLRPRRRVKQPNPASETRSRAFPGTVAALLTGAIVGLLTVGGTWGLLHLCSALRGTSTCGGPGVLLLLALLAALVFVGGGLLRAWGVSEPRSISFLAIPALCMATYAVSH